jgi:hypothetical protein
MDDPRLCPDCNQPGECCHRTDTREEYYCTNDACTREIPWVVTVQRVSVMVPCVLDEWRQHTDDQLVLLWQANRALTRANKVLMGWMVVTVLFVSLLIYVNMHTIYALRGHTHATPTTSQPQDEAPLEGGDSTD